MLPKDSRSAGVSIVYEPGGEQDGRDLSTDIQRNVGIPVDLRAEGPRAPLGLETIIVTVLTSVLTKVAGELVMETLKRWLASRREEQSTLNLQLEIRRTKRSSGRRFLLQVGVGKYEEVAVTLKAAQDYIVEISAPRKASVERKHS